MVEGSLGAALKHYDVSDVIDLSYRRVTKPDVLRLPEDGTNRVGHFCWLEHGGGDLVEEREERVKIVLVNNGDAHLFIGQPFGDGDAPKAASNDHDMGQVGEIRERGSRIGGHRHIYVKHS
jgi:hypothetical protein